MTVQVIENIELIYDDQCPVCRSYCRNVKLDKDSSHLNLIDARKNSPLMEEVNARGLDIDQGMVLKVGDALFYGSDAMHQVSLRAQNKGWTALVNRIFFRTRGLTHIFYPAGKTVRNFLLRLKGIQPIHNLKPKNTLKHQLGDDWKSLHPNVQERFDLEPKVGERVIYQGVMQEIRRSRMGWLFASLTRLVGNPLTPFQGQDIPMEVALYKKEGNDGVFWQRTYLYPGKKPYIVVSEKRESKAGEMLECVGGGFGMKLKVTAQNGDMHFESYRYFWTFLQYRIPLPHWITPGKAHVIHTDLGKSEFMYSISMVHKQLGETFYQRGVFRLKGE